MVATKTLTEVTTDLACAVAYLVTRVSDLDNLEIVTINDARLIHDLKQSVGEVFAATDALCHELRQHVDVRA